MRWALLLALCLAAATGCRAIRQFDPNNRWIPADGEKVREADLMHDDTLSWANGTDAVRHK